MKHEELFVDETTRKTMEYISDGISDSLNDFLRSSDALKTIEKQISEILKGIEIVKKLPESTQSVIRDTQKKNQQELSKKLSESQSLLVDAVKNALSDLAKSIAGNQKALIAQIKSLDAKIEANSRRLEEIAEKVDYINLPFYKKIAKKPGKNQPEVNTEEE